MLINTAAVIDLISGHPSDISRVHWLITEHLVLTGYHPVVLSSPCAEEPVELSL